MEIDKSSTSEWRRMRTPGGHGYHWGKPMEPSIQRQMPKRTKIFTETSAIDLIRADLRKLLYNLEVTIKGGTTSTPPPEDF